MRSMKSLGAGSGWTRRISGILCALALLSGSISPSSFAAAAPIPTDNPHGSAWDSAVDQSARAFFAKRCHVGMSIVVVDGDQTHFYDYGSTSRTQAALATPQSIYEIASLTKTFTATLAAQAVLDGRMQLDGDFRSDLPGDYSNLALDNKPVTLRTLLTHYSGMPRDIPDSDAILATKDFTTIPARYVAINQGFGREQFLAALHTVKLRSMPGKKRAYSNAGFQLIGLGLETVYGKPYDVLLRQRIIQPLGMTSTGLTLSSAVSSHLVTGYDRAGRPAPPRLQDAGAAWGLYSSPEDMAKYLRWQLDGQDPVIHLSHRILMGTADHGEAMAWNLQIDHGQPVVWHSGGSFGTSSQMMLYPKQHQGIVLLANDTCADSEDALKDMAMAIHAAARKIPIQSAQEKAP